MFYVSKISPPLFLFAVLNLLLSLFLKLVDYDTVLFFVVLVFGFVGNTLLGAMYQIIPNSQNRKLSFHQLSYLVFAGVLVSFSLFYLGVYREASLLLAASYVLFFIHSLVNVKNWMPVTVRFLGVSALYLALSSILLALHFNLGVVPLQLALHSLTVGSMLNAVYGVEIAWVPMLLMETLNIRKAQRLFYVKQASTLVLLVSFFFMSYKLISLASLLELGVALYFIYILYGLVMQRRMPSPLPYVVKTFFLALVFLPFGLILGTFISSHVGVLPELFRLHIDFLVYGFTAFTIFGGMSHLFPRIMWNWKFSSKKEGKVPAVNELIDEQGYPSFLEKAVVAFTMFVALDSLFYPLNKLSVLPYLFLLFAFVKITFIHFLKKLKEV
ncbi:hypothetical protein [Hydrogenivirga sp. 128-5-R1-1]|uniref:hypothetical protein n=1 Tax=Hydrogenivirga sp. 128-5-R1-1 TaxID=392423 RepID=UPI00015F3833|nr:hypothetical protein [Hydrogenivirga sp. 128-5-R1-1]EDP76592.1 hypothetical protein HG1285_03258 [Hydrogenivirga sp. 128-5-R1-1]